MGRKRKLWKYRAGRRPCTVTVYERNDGGVHGVLYGAVWDPARGRHIRRSLGHRDKARATAWADEQAARLRLGAERMLDGRVTFGEVVELYLEHRSPKKAPTQQKSDHRLAEMWLRYLGRDRDPHHIRLAEWESFIEARSSGALDARGRPVPADDRRPVRDRSVEGNLSWLSRVFRWASRWRTIQGTYLMRENPVRGFETPKEKNPLRPVATQDRFEAVRAAAEGMQMEVRWFGKRRRQRSHLPELLDLANATGRRIGAICALLYEDLVLNDGTPHGSIRWRADTDKQGRESTIPMDPQARRAIDRVLSDRPGLGRAPLFPKPADVESPVTRHLADKWLRRAEVLAGLEPQKGSLWHAYRRKWVTERKHHPVQDVARAGGWKSHAVVQDVYTQSDPATMLRVVLEAAELREVGAD